MTGIAVSVYEPDGATLIAHVPRRRGVQFLDELNGDGHGQFDVHLDDALLVAKPTLLDGGNIVKMRPTNVAAPVFGWQIEDVAQALTVEGERAERFATVQGRGVRTLLASGQLYPEYGLTATSADDRGFTAASADGPWRVSADWVAPVGVAQNVAAYPWAGYPLGWPDPAAQWLWSSGIDVADPVGRNWFRSSFTLSSPAIVGFYATADNLLSLSVNGDVVLESLDATDQFIWHRTLYVSMPLAAGTHQVAAWVDNTTSTAALNPGGFLCTIATLDADEIPLVVKRRSDTTNWTCHAYPPPEPGWHAASILKQAITESQARSEVQIVPLTLGFTDTLDTAGVAWSDIISERFPIGGDLLSMLGRLIELGLDAEVTPDLVVNAWARKGTDLSATVRLLPGRDVTSNVPTARYGALRNSAIVRHGVGWVLVEDAASVAAHGRRSAQLTLGSADSDTQATQQAQAFFDESAHPQVTLPLSMTSASTGPQPYAQFVNGDTVTAPGLGGVLGAARVMSIRASEGAASDGVVGWELSLYPETS